MSDDTEITKAEISRRSDILTAPLSSLVAGLVLIIAVVVGWMMFRPQSGGGGRPVPAPRDTPNEQTSTPSAEDQTITVSPEVVRRAGIKIESVGEQVSTDTASSVVTTGIVQANAYRATPVVSLVGGIVRRVNAELGQTVARDKPWLLFSVMNWPKFNRAT